MHTILCRLFRVLFLAALLAAPPLRAADNMDELTRQVAAYELTLPKIEAYGAAMSSLADWAVANPKEAAAIAKRTPKNMGNLKASIAFIEKEAAIFSTLKRFDLSSADYILIPAATMQAGIAALGVQQGRSFPTDRINPKNIALIQAHQAQIDRIITKVRADQARITGPKN